MAKRESAALYDNPRSKEEKVAGRYLDPKKDDDASAMIDVEEAKRSTVKPSEELSKKVLDMVKKKTGGT